MVKHRGAGFQKPIDSGKRKPVRMAVISQGDGYAECSCGQPFRQKRDKVREIAIDKHLRTKHQGKGLWL